MIADRTFNEWIQKYPHSSIDAQIKLKFQIIAKEPLQIQMT